MVVAENFALRGLRVTIVELLDQAVPPLDKDMAELVEKHLKEKGVTLLTSEQVKAFESKDGKRVSSVVTSKRTLPADIVLLSVGIRPRTQLAAEAGIELGVKKAIRVNDKLETSIPGIYAVGDCAEGRHLVTGKPAWIPLGSTANKHGRVAGVNVAGGNERFEVVGREGPLGQTAHNYHTTKTAHKPFYCTDHRIQHLFKHWKIYKSYHCVSVVCDLYRCRWRFLRTARRGVLAAGVKPTARWRIEEAARSSYRSSRTAPQAARRRTLLEEVIRSLLSCCGSTQIGSSAQPRTRRF